MYSHDVRESLQNVLGHAMVGIRIQDLFQLLLAHFSIQLEEALRECFVHKLLLAEEVGIFHFFIIGHLRVEYLLRALVDQIHLNMELGHLFALPLELLVRALLDKNVSYVFNPVHVFAQL